jgi:hypothetical protein
MAQLVALAAALHIPALVGLVIRQVQAQAKVIPAVMVVQQAHFPVAAVAALGLLVQMRLAQPLALGVLDRNLVLMEPQRIMLAAAVLAAGQVQQVD